MGTDSLQHTLGQASQETMLYCTLGCYRVYTGALDCYLVYTGALGCYLVYIGVLGSLLGQ